MLKMAATTSKRPDPSQVEWAKRVSEQLGIPYVPRENKGVAALIERYGLEVLIVAEQHRLVVKRADGPDFFWHPSSAKLNWGSGGHLADTHFMKALAIEPGDRVLDCTLGLASDAILISEAVGTTGRVVGLEASPLIALLASEGLRSWREADAQVLEAMRRIEVVQADHAEYLKTLADHAFDVVYFDPMFRQPNERSVSINPLRGLAEHRGLSEAVIREALRVARRRVVIKERLGSGEFERLGVEVYFGERRREAVGYGVIQVPFDKHSVLDR